MGIKPGSIEDERICFVQRKNFTSKANSTLKSLIKDYNAKRSCNANEIFQRATLDVQNFPVNSFPHFKFLVRYTMC